MAGGIESRQAGGRRLSAGEIDRSDENLEEGKGTLNPENWELGTGKQNDKAEQNPHKLNSKTLKQAVHGPV